MPQTRYPRRGSMQFWPRKKAGRIYARVRHWANSDESKLLGFAGYKAGMTHLLAVDNRKNSQTKGEIISIPATIIECPPIKIAGIRGYAGSRILCDILAPKLDKEAGRKLKLPKKTKENDIEKKINEATDIRLLVCTQPKLTTIGKKKPEIFEIAIGGKIEDKLKFAKENLGKEISVNNVFKEGNQIDIHAITKGKGNQGPVKRFGVKIRQHKAEKTKRGPGTLGPWHPHHGNYRVPHAGQMGYHQRLEYNKWIIKITNPEEINKKEGFARYGVLKNTSLLVKGSVAGPAKRLIRFNKAIRPNKKMPEETLTIQMIAK